MSIFFIFNTNVRPLESMFEQLTQLFGDCTLLKCSLILEDAHFL